MGSQFEHSESELALKSEVPGFIVIEGPIGVGKTTLANKLASSFGSDLLLEGADENPFLEKFYENYLKNLKERLVIYPIKIRILSELFTTFLSIIQ